MHSSDFTIPSLGVFRLKVIAHLVGQNPVWAELGVFKNSQLTFCKLLPWRTDLQSHRLQPVALPCAGAAPMVSNLQMQRNTCNSPQPCGMNKHKLHQTAASRLDMQQTHWTHICCWFASNSLLRCPFQVLELSASTCHL